MKYINKIENYNSKLDLVQTEIAIKYVKDTFERLLANSLNLTRVSAPLFVYPESGLNDYLNGYERVVKFDVLDLGKDVEIVQSLAKWKRNALKKYNFQIGQGLYTDMNAIRRDEDLDAIHSIYVDQWDWEKTMIEEERTFDYLKDIVNSVYSVIKETSDLVNNKFEQINVKLPEHITFINSNDLLKMYPNNTSKEREHLITEKYGAVFIHQIGWKLDNNQPHDGRAADYDDWTLNGDILVWNNVIKSSFELSSMGIRVNKDSLVKQLTEKNEMWKLDNDYCQNIINDRLPLTVGGGIGQSRLCMFMLEKAHIGEVQVSVWGDEYIKELKKKNIHLLY